MKRIVIVAGFLGVAGLISAAPAGAQTPGDCAPAKLCEIAGAFQQNINGQPVRQFVVGQLDQFLNGNPDDPQDPHPGLLNQRDHFVNSVRDFFGAGEADPE